MMYKLTEFLRKPRFKSNDFNRTSKSPFQWGLSDCSGYHYQLSLLGMINDVLPKLGIVLVAVLGDVPKDDRLKIVKKWW